MSADAVAAAAAALVLVEKVLSSLARQQNLEKKVRNEVGELGTCLRRLKAYSADMDGKESSQQLKARGKEIREVANETEDVLEEFMFHVPHRFHRHKISEQFHEIVFAFRLRNPLSSIQVLVSNIGDVKRKINNILTLDQLGNIGTTTMMEEGSSSGSKPEHQMAPRIADDEKIVGFEEHKEALIRQLTDKVPGHMRISVVGPGGSGKTTLVKDVYESNTIWGQFDCRAWVKVSKPFDTEELFCRMLKEFCGSREEPIPSERIDTGAKLRHYLQHKRYVVVLDDMWRKEHWDSIRNVFPSGPGSSRIIVTTQNREVASYCVESNHCIRETGLLSSPKAWDLFCRKAFPTGDGKCPRELVEWSQMIVKRCEGLPLAIVAIGSLLSKKQQIPSEWKKVHDGLGSEIGTDSKLSIISKIVLRSYMDLPTHLKSCFLYFSIFPEDYSIDRGRLVRLWIAEGFVLKRRGLTLEQVAEDYLHELIERNLVQAGIWDFDGRARYCRVLNLVHEFIIGESEELNLISLLEEPHAISSKKVRRLCLHDDDCISTLLKSTDLKYVRSAFLFKRGKVSSSSINKILRAFKLLRVLDLRDAPLDIFPEDIVVLNLLRYLCLRNTKIKKIPTSIKNLSYLETLDLKQTNVTTLPKEILLLHNLRHLLVYGYNVKNYVTWDSVVGVEMAAGIEALTNLQKLSLVKSDKLHKLVQKLGALTQLRKLGLIGLKKEDGKYLCASIQKMENLSTLDVSSTSKEESLDLNEMDAPPPLLQRLYLKGHLQRFPGWISKLNNLFRIHLKWSRLGSSPLKDLQELPNLLELEMVDAFTGVELVFDAGRFKKLKKLRIEQFDELHTVVVREGAMPVLQKLTLCKCVRLEMLPLGINYLARVEELLLYDMPVGFIGRLQKSHEYREMVRHIPVIKSWKILVYTPHKWVYGMHPFVWCTICHIILEELK